MAKVFIIMFIVFIILGLAAIVHAAITAPTLDEETNRYIHWKKAKAYFKNKWAKQKEQAPAVEEEIAKELLKPVDPPKLIIVKPIKFNKPLPQVLNKDGSVRKRPGPKPGSHNKKK
jgi:hypothetical protein